MTHPFFDRDLAADLGFNIRHLRERAELTSATLAARCCMDPARLAAVEAGAELVTPTEILTVMQRLRCGFGDLFADPRREGHA